MTMPGWVFPEPDLVLEDPDWHRIVLFVGGNDDQEGLLFMRVEDSDEAEASIVAMDSDEVTAMRDHMTKWIDWYVTRQGEPT